MEHACASVGHRDITASTMQGHAGAAGELFASLGLYFRLLQRPKEPQMLLAPSLLEMEARQLWQLLN